MKPAPAAPLVLAAALLGIAGPLLACRPAEPPEGPPITAPFADHFDRPVLGDDWRTTAPEAYQLSQGALNGRGAHNHPLWLARRLPPDAIIEIDAWSRSPAGDLKLELYGDGRSFARDRGQYTSTGYVAVMGGWSNSVSVLVAGNEHRKDRPERRTPRVEVGRRYHWKLIKRGDTVEWFVDDMTTPFLTYRGEALGGPDHAYLAISDWESDAWFDDLSITPI